MKKIAEYLLGFHCYQRFLSKFLPSSKKTKFVTSQNQSNVLNLLRIDLLINNTNLFLFTLVAFTANLESLMVTEIAYTVKPCKFSIYQILQVGTLKQEKEPQSSGIDITKYGNRNHKSFGILCTVFQTFQGLQSIHGKCSKMFGNFFLSWPEEKTIIKALSHIPFQL